MPRRKLSLMVVCGLALLLLSATAASAASTHLGVPPNNFVTLKYDSGEFFRVEKNGKVASSPFKIPNKQVLILTDVDWVFTGGNSGNVYVLKLKILSGSNDNTVFVTQATAGANSDGGTNVHLTSGFVLQSGAKVDADFSSLPIEVTTTHLFLHGYITGQ